jgi:hypothetical protein
MAARNKTDRSMIAQIAAHERWSRCPDTRAATAAARAAAMGRFEKEVDPDGTMEPEERTRRAESARKAYFTRLALQGVQARRQRATGKQG